MLTAQRALGRGFGLSNLPACLPQSARELGAVDGAGHLVTALLPRDRRLALAVMVWLQFAVVRVVSVAVLSISAADCVPADVARNIAVRSQAAALDAILGWAVHSDATHAAIGPHHSPLASAAAIARSKRARTSTWLCVSLNATTGS